MKGCCISWSHLAFQREQYGFSCKAVTWYLGSFLRLFQRKRYKFFWAALNPSGNITVLELIQPYVKTPQLLTIPSSHLNMGFQPSSWPFREQLKGTSFCGPSLARTAPQPPLICHHPFSKKLTVKGLSPIMYPRRQSIQFTIQSWILELFSQTQQGPSVP